MADVFADLSVPFVSSAVKIAFRTPSVQWLRGKGLAPGQATDPAAFNGEIFAVL